MKHLLTHPTRTTLPLSELADPPDNPNHMPVDKYLALRDAIAHAGWLQPPLVAELTDYDPDIDTSPYVIVDGVHRCRAGRELELGTVEVVKITASRAEARALQLTLNRLRGELNLVEVGASLELLVTAGWTADDLNLTGFSQHEVDQMLELASAAATEGQGDIVQGAAAALTDDDDEPPAKHKPFSLEVTFATATELKAVKKALRKAAKPSKDLAVGLKRLIEGA